MPLATVRKGRAGRGTHKGKPFMNGAGKSETLHSTGESPEQR